MDVATRVTRVGTKPKNQTIKYIFILAHKYDTNSHPIWACFACISRCYWECVTKTPTPEEILAISSSHIALCFTNIY
jgi:heterodisulfide reductase subunit C